MKFFMKEMYLGPASSCYTNLAPYQLEYNYKELRKFVDYCLGILNGDLCTSLYFYYAKYK